LPPGPPGAPLQGARNEPAQSRRADPADGVDARAHLARRAITEPRYIGIRTGGVWVAQALLKAMGDTALGTLDVSFYRDDFSQNGLHPQVRPSALPFEIEGQHLVLIDDVLMSGRTIRAASTNCSTTAARPA
jgi:pyrimidine operon attenuation protein/uracil phosphoribosyltransferase